MMIKLDNAVTVAVNDNLTTQIDLPTADKDFDRRDFDQFRTEITQQVADLQTFTEENTSLFGSLLGNILLFSVVLEAVLLILVFICLTKLSDFKERHNKLRQTCSAQEETIKKLSKKVESLTKEITSIKTAPPIVNRDAAPRNIEVHSFTSVPTVQLEKPPSPPPPPIVTNQIAPEEKFTDFVKAFNSLANQGGYDAKKARDEFVQKYRVRAFNCINFEARMNDPIPPPVFGEATNGEYWAIPFADNSFFVFPNVKIYSDNHHTARAMGEVFKSNFASGGTYSKITVEKPAVFECAGNVWTLKRQGKLGLG